MDDTLRKLQMTQLEMLKLVDRVCRKNGICYSLYAGTLLGAVRHKGFIPWDDDLDICMSRKEYDRFLAVWDRLDHDGYFLQNKENSPSFSQSFSKIRKDHTTFVETEGEAGLYHNGIFIDIFPIDRIPNGRIKRGLFQWRCMRYQLYTREFVPSGNGSLLRIGSQALLHLTLPRRYPAKRKKLLHQITENNNNSSLPTVGIERFSTMGVPLPPSLMDHFIDLPFEDGLFMCTALWDEYLKDKFGNYMQYPPLEEQTWRHHPIILDFEHNYGECPEVV